MISTAMKKLWDKGYDTDKAVETFTVGNDKELDLILAKYDVQGSIAHAKMLESIGLLKKSELQDLTRVLNTISKTIEDGQFTIEEGFEDVHSQVEHLLTQALGETGKKIHAGRSRNDQVLVDLHLYMKAEIGHMAKDIKNLFDQLILLSNKYKDHLLPGYTHLQIAMPSSFGLWFGAYAESFIDDIHLLSGAFKIVNQNPLGSGAGYGSSFPLDRQMTTDLLSFESMKYNVVAAQMSRGKAEKSIAFAMASVAGTLARLSMDVCLYMSQNFGFITFPDSLTTGSSIMPHKKNPDVFELIRAKCNKIQALPVELTLITNNLPSGYHRDFQILKESFFPAIENLKSCLQISLMMFENIIVKNGFMESEKYKYLYSVESVNSQVLQGVPFRDAYKNVGNMIEKGEFKPSTSVNHTHAGSIGNLCNEEIGQKMEKAIKLLL